MSLPDVLLSLLRQPMSGTDLIELFDGSMRHFWKTDLSQIYKSLESLESNRFLTSASAPSPRGPARRVYSLTRAGERRLVDWVRRAPAVPPARLEYLAQLFSVTADERPRERALEQLRAICGEAEEAAMTLEGIESALATFSGYPDRLPSYLFYPWLTLRHGLLRRRALVEWIDESIAALEARPDEVDRARDVEAIAGLIELIRSFAPSGENTVHPTRST